MRNLPPNITLVGFMGSGKTTVGRLLARRLGWSFVDTDEIVARASGKSIPEVFAEEGEEGFRDRETQAILGVAAGEKQVIATGGGAVLRAENGAALRAAGPVIWLTVRPEVVVARTARRAAERPLLARASEEGNGDLLAHILRMLGERGPKYQAVAHLVVDASDRAPHAVAAEIERRAGRWAGQPFP